MPAPKQPITTPKNSNIENEAAINRKINAFVSKTIPVNNNGLRVVDSFISILHLINLS
jgi:hypothetical protein